MKRKSILLVFILGLGILTGAAWQPEKAEADSDVMNFTLDEAIEYGLKNSPEIKKLEIDEKIAEVNLKSAKSGASKSKDARDKYSTGTSWETLQVEMVNPVLQEANYKIQEKSLRHMRDALKLQIEKKYYDVIYAKKSLENSQESLDRANEELRLAEVKYEVGNIAKIGVKQAEAQAASKQASYIAAKNKYQNEIMAFNKLLGLPLDAKINLISGLELKGEDINLEAAISEAIEKDISVFSKREMLKVAEVSLEAAKKIYSPKVNTYKQMLYELEKSKIDLQEQEKELKMTIKETYLSLKALEGQYEALEKAVDAASEGYRLTKISYEVGIATQVELMQRAEELHQAETNLLNVLYNYNVLKAQFQNRIFLTSPGGTGGQNG
ncbi:MAG: outer membrane protein TolC [Clostridiales bacterium]|nr:outer membrane protein TolC [Clostridiales bacterium]